MTPIHIDAMTTAPGYIFSGVALILLLSKLFFHFCRETSVGRSGWVLVASTVSRMLCFSTNADVALLDVRDLVQCSLGTR